MGKPLDYVPFVHPLAVIPVEDFARNLKQNPKRGCWELLGENLGWMI